MDLILDSNDNPYPQEVLWINREKMSDSFFDPNQQGTQSMGPNIDRDSESD